MIKANELRIGNNIFNGVITSINKDGFTFFDGFQEWHSKKLVSETILPTPLTPEILEKCGFCLHKNLVYIHKHHARIRITKQLELLLDNNLWVELKYLHQLQNLYFALTGEELTFNP